MLLKKGNKQNYYTYIRTPDKKWVNFELNVESTKIMKWGFLWGPTQRWFEIELKPKLIYCGCGNIEVEFHFSWLKFDEFLLKFELFWKRPSQIWSMFSKII